MNRSVPSSLALWLLGSLLLPYAAIAAMDFNDIADIAAGWISLATLGLPCIAVLHAWLLARLDRRLDGPSRSRSWTLLEGPGVALAAMCLPVVLHGLALAATGLVVGPWGWVGRGMVAVPFAIGLLLAAGLVFAARRVRTGRSPLPHDPGTIGDIVPTAWLWIGWLSLSHGLLGIGAAALASNVSLPEGIALLAVSSAVVVGVCLLVARQVAALPPEHITAPVALAREVAGATAVGLLLPVFLAGLMPMWRNAEDTRWALLLGLLVMVPLAVWTLSSGRVTRWARWS